jgi:pimeloyl-ACP methyl ester carboxylesterase
MKPTLEDKNKTIVRKAFDTLFNRRDYAAAEKFWSPNYIQRSAHIPPGREGLFNLVKNSPATLKYENQLILANGDFLMLHGRFSGLGPGIPNWIVVDIVRVEKGVLAEHYTLYMQDYGAPVGFRMALAHPQRVEALIVQDGVAHNEGLGANWKTRRAFWEDRAPIEAALRTNLLSLQTTKTRHIGDDPNVVLYDPDLWTDEYAFLNAPGQAEIQSDLFYDYRTNVDAYPKWQTWMQKTQSTLLVIWGKHDLSFDLDEPDRYRKDVPKAEVHVLDASHFALDTKADEIAGFVREFMKCNV